MDLPFVSEYARSNRSACRRLSCMNKTINKGELRLGAIYQSDYFDGKQMKWFHPECFFHNHQPESVDVLSGFGTLQTEHQEFISNKIKNGMKRKATNHFRLIDEADSSIMTIKRPKIEVDGDDGMINQKIRNEMKIQNDRCKQVHKILVQVKHNDLEKILEHNKQGITERKGFKRATMDLVCDILTFGAIKSCSECEGQLIFKNTGYKCTGPINAWAKCMNVVKEPERFEAKIPQKLLEKYPLLETVNPRVEARIIPVEITALEDQTSTIYESVPKTMTMLLKNGSVVDPESGLQNKAHVYKEHSKHWSSVLTKIDVQSSRNSYYKLQLLEADDDRKYWVFRSWGRIGTTIGHFKCERFRGLEEAKQEFEDEYKKKTNNHWGTWKFVKYLDKYYELDIDYNDDQIKMESNSSSNLAIPVQNLIKMIFDVDLLTEQMVEMKLDTNKMPLGQLSYKQIRLARGVLEDLELRIKRDAHPNELLSESNRFYHHVPHNFGVKRPPILNNMKDIQSKIAMLDNLQGIEVAYKMLQVDSASGTNPIDNNYKQLNTEISVLDKETEEFTTLAKYVKNTHGPTHNFEIGIMDIFKVKRKDDEPFNQLHNRRLLWHGSHQSQFARILSQGLKIAPPEASISGCKFGKGIYFTDMVSKAAEYTKSADMGLILLCEVALGDIQEFTKANDMTEPPNGKHSVKGVGKYYPDPKQSIIRENVEIPLGKRIKHDKETSLTYNEFVVYDAAQVRIQYLFQVNFKQ